MVKHSRLALVTLLHGAVAAADDAKHRRSQSQRRALYLEALLAFMKVCANGDLTPCVARCFGTAKHVSFLKNAAGSVAGGLRPLAVGTVLRRLASILVLHKALPFVADYLLPHQVSKNAAVGTDILVHGFREKLEQFGHDPDKVALRVDAANAFNAVSRAEMLERFCGRVPSAARFVHDICGG
jgi:hypothetical protein